MTDCKVYLVVERNNIKYVYNSHPDETIPALTPAPEPVLVPAPTVEIPASVPAPISTPKKLTLKRKATDAQQPLAAVPTTHQTPKLTAKRKPTTVTPQPPTQKRCQ